MARYHDDFVEWHSLFVEIKAVSEKFSGEFDIKLVSEPCKMEIPRTPGLSIILITDCSREEGAWIKWINMDDSQVYSLTTKHLKLV